MTVFLVVDPSGQWASLNMKEQDRLAEGAVPVQDMISWYEQSAILIFFFDR